jgi:hypothetical protein
VREFRQSDSDERLRPISLDGSTVDYEPWPERGCTLAEARTRIAGLQQITGQFVAYGRSCDAGAALQLIAREIWPLLTNFDWHKSSVSRDPTGNDVFVDLRLFPPLLAPSRVDFIAGAPLSEAFRTYVLEDPEVAALAREAIRLSPEWTRVFVEGRCYRTGAADWPVAFERRYHDIVHPDPEKRSRFAARRDVDPIEAVIAAEALNHRYGVLISMVRGGQLVAHGLSQASGRLEEIPRSIWSHDDFSFDAKSGDLFQLNDLSEGWRDRLIRRWIGVVLQRPVLSAASRPFGSKGSIAPRSSEAMFHMNSTGHAPSPSNPVAHDQGDALGQQPTALQASIESAVAAIWPGGVPAGLSLKMRDRKIMEWQKVNGLGMASSKTIRRHLKRGA